MHAYRCAAGNWALVWVACVDVIASVKLCSHKITIMLAKHNFEVLMNLQLMLVQVNLVVPGDQVNQSNQDLPTGI